jgi:lysophospholipase L1-like esterase
MDRRSTPCLDPLCQCAKEDPALPRVLLIGDSISIGYTPAAREALAEKANVHRIPENGGDTWRGLAKLNLWLAGGKWDVIHFNFGLHDLKHIKDSKLDLAGEQVSSLETYKANLNKLTGELKKTGARLIWATTTPVPEGANGRLRGDDVIYNAAALQVVEKQGIPVNDLHAHILPELEQFQRFRDVHFTPEGYLFLGRKVAAEIQKAL